MKGQINFIELNSTSRFITIAFYIFIYKSHKNK